jgi:2-hydroxychromene-2-carboxylate isomerase
VDGLNIAEASTLTALARDIGGLSLASSDSVAAKEELQANTDEALSIGAFGVPTFLVENPATSTRRMFFGQVSSRAALVSL